MSDLSKSVEGYRTYGNFYDDKKMKSDYDDYTSKIKDLEDKLNDYEDKWYSQVLQNGDGTGKAAEQFQRGDQLVRGS